ncbi:MAG TPA: glycoside hydrolase family 97 N-terminal domain-containing protein [Verrucomicrobiae bacterium]|nr:glycoside hydrolase family 97 N-terminal domain-containing protein [Verrucomicrobiae bacterium]
MIVCGVFGIANGVFAATPTTVLSPDGAIRFALQVQEERLKFYVTFRNKAAIETSPLSITVDGVDLAEGVDPGALKRYELKETYPWRGVHSKATNHCNGVTIPLKHRKSGTGYTLEVRAFNDGVAFRHVIPGGEKARVPDEATKFTLPVGSTVWHHDLEGHYEDVYTQSDVAEIKAGDWCAPPLTFKLAGAAGYASVTEAALVNYSGMALQADAKRGFDLVLGHKHHVSYPFRLRYSNDVERVSKPASVTGTITSPWRVVMMGADLNALVNSDIVHNLCHPPDANLFPKGMQTDWIKPGRAVWRYLDGGRNTFEEMKDFSRWAGELGFEYHVIEGFWSRWSDEQIKGLADDSRQRGVGLFLWKHSRQLRTPEAREEFFKKISGLGAVGAKIDFFDHEHKEVVDLYTALLEEAAKYRIMVNFHGANKPAGEARTWPNELIREAVRGMEASRLRERARHNTTLPFTRYLAGHGDYTPVHFGARRGDTTWAHQIATAAVFDEPLLTYGAHPTNLLANPAVEMIKSIPAAWDETRVLPMSEIGELAALARRSGNTWFLAVLNGPEAKTVAVPLAFLGSGQYRASVVRDRKDDPAAVQIEDASANRNESWTFELAPGGGCIARFRR